MRASFALLVGSLLLSAGCLGLGEEPNWKDMHLTASPEAPGPGDRVVLSLSAPDDRHVGVSYFSVFPGGTAGRSASGGAVSIAREDIRAGQSMVWFGEYYDDRGPVFSPVQTILIETPGRSDELSLVDDEHRPVRLDRSFNFTVPMGNMDHPDVDSTFALLDPEQGVGGGSAQATWNASNDAIEIFIDFPWHYQNSPRVPPDCPGTLERQRGCTLFLLVGAQEGASSIHRVFEFRVVT